ncbi:hypothetical protein IWQ60_005112, partial [Tieghemiomyces parasiticus]
MEWLHHSNKSKCELCRHQFAFSPVYDPAMPQHIPLLVVGKRVIIHAGTAVLTAIRLVLVAFVWLILLPYMTVWILRFFFWSGQAVAYAVGGDAHLIPGFLNYTQTLRNQQTHLVASFNTTLLPAVLIGSLAQPDGPSPALNQFIFDCLEGEIVTSSVVLVFMILFVLREWIVANAPLPNLEVEPDHPEEPAPVEAAGARAPPAAEEPGWGDTDNANEDEDQAPMDEYIPRDPLGHPEWAHPPLPRATLPAQDAGPREPRRVRDPWAPALLPAEAATETPGPWDDLQSPLGDRVELPEETAPVPPTYNLRRRRWRHGSMSSYDADESAVNTEESVSGGNPTSPSTARMVRHHPRAIGEGSSPARGPPYNDGVEEEESGPAWARDLVSRFRDPDRAGPSASHRGPSTQEPLALGDNVYALGFGTMANSGPAGATAGPFAIAHEPAEAGPSRRHPPQDAGFPSFGVSPRDTKVHRSSTSSTPLSAPAGDTHPQLFPSPPSPPAHPGAPFEVGRFDHDPFAPDPVHRATAPPPPDHLNEPLGRQRAELLDGHRSDSSDSVWTDEDGEGDRLARALPRAEVEVVDADDEDDAEDGAGPRPQDNGGDADPMAAANDFEFQDDLLDAEGIDGILEALGIRGPIVNLFQYFVLIFSLISLVLGAVIWFPYTVGKLVLVLNPFHMLTLPLTLLERLTDSLVNGIVDHIPLWVYQATRSWAAGPLDQLADGRVFPSASILHPGKAILYTDNWFTAMIWSLVDQLQALARTLISLIANPAHQTAALGHDLLLGLQTGWETLAYGDGLGDRFLTCAVGVGTITLVATYIMYGGYDVVGERTRAVKQAIRTGVSMAKVLFLIVLELILFPTFCGALLDLVTLDLFPTATGDGGALAARLAYIRAFPLTSTFLHWFIGTAFMFLFALFISVCRETIRPGVLWFIRDPNDPQFHPMKEILERPTTTQLRKFMTSVVMYSVMIVGGVGVVIWTVAHWPASMSPSSTSGGGGRGILPLRLQFNHPLSSLALDLLILHLIISPTLHLLRLRRLFLAIVRRWWRVTARRFRLTSFMFGERVAEEEGYYVRHGLWARLTRRRFALPPPDLDEVDPEVHGQADAMAEGQAGDRAVVDSQNTLTRRYVHRVDGAPDLESRTDERSRETHTERYVDPADPNVAFQRDGCLLRVPNYDAIPVIPDHRVLVHIDRFGQPWNPAEDYPEQRNFGREGEDPPHLPEGTADAPPFTKVYAPPHLRIRLVLFLIVMWLSLAILACVTLIVPLVTGRALFARLFGALARAAQHPTISDNSTLGRFSAFLFDDGQFLAALFQSVPWSPDTEVHDSYSLVLGGYVCGTAVWLAYFVNSRWTRTMKRYAERVATSQQRIPGRNSGDANHGEPVGRRHAAGPVPHWTIYLAQHVARWVVVQSIWTFKAATLFLSVGIILPTYLGLLGELYVGLPIRMAAVHSVETWFQNQQAKARATPARLGNAAEIGVGPDGSPRFVEIPDSQPTPLDPWDLLLITLQAQAQAQNPGVSPPSSLAKGAAVRIRIPPSLFGVSLNPDWLRKVYRLPESAAVGSSKRGSLDDVDDGGTASNDVDRRQFPRVEVLGAHTPTERPRPEADRQSHGDAQTPPPTVDRPIFPNSVQYDPRQRSPPGTRSASPLHFPYPATLYLLQYWVSGLVLLKLLHSITVMFPDTGLAQRWQLIIGRRGQIRHANLRALFSHLMGPTTALTLTLVVLPPLLGTLLLYYGDRYDLLLDAHLL